MAGQSGEEEDEVTRLKRALAEMENELLRERARATVLEQAGNLGSWDVVPATGLGTWSPKMYELYYQEPGGEPPSLDSMPRLVHPDDVATVGANMGALMSTGHAPPVVFRTHPDLGPARYLRAAVTRVVESEGGFRVYGGVSDVTDQVRLEGELAASVRTLEAVYQHAPYTIFAIDAEWRVSFINRVSEGVDVAEVVGRRLVDMVSEGHQSEVEALMERLFRDGGEGQLEAADERGTLWDSRYVALRGPDGTVDSVLGFSRDVTETRALQRQLEHAQKLESLGVLAGGIAHDFNNLLVGILGNADLALLELSPTSPARQSVDEILTSSHRAAELCRQMLAYAGKGRFVVQSMDLRELVREMTHLLDVSISKNATLRYEFDDATDPVEGDATQLRQIVMNLITNASDAVGDDGGIITIATGTLECDADYLSQAYLRDDLPPGRYTFLEVSDTGCGMDEATIDQMFDPFFTSKTAGRGLGLAAVLGIVRSHDGAIRVYSEVGKGTSIKVLFPACDDAAVPSASDRLAATGAVRGGTVLVIDDEPVVRRLAARMLEKLGYRTLTAVDGVDGLERYREHREEIVAVLLDMTMPRMDGKTTFAELRRIDADVKVLLCSGYNEQDATSRFAGKGLAGFLQKPYRSTDLAAALDALFDPS